MVIRHFIYAVMCLQFAIQGSLLSWWDAGHMAVATIAYEDLRPDVKEKVNTYLKAASDSFPNHADFVSASLWADDIVHEGIDVFFEWHGSARPYDPYEVLSKEQHLKIIDKFEGNDIVWAIKKCLKTIDNPKASPWAKGFMLRMLIHIVGDIHQPCHCTTYFSPEFPIGDRAGTAFKINNVKYPSLHKLTDAAFGLGDKMIERPIRLEDIKYVEDLAAFLKEQYPREALEGLHQKEVDRWRQESYEIGVNFLYTQIEPHASLTPDYVEKGKTITGQRLALAGYRLADLLNGIL